MVNVRRFHVLLACAAAWPALARGEPALDQEQPLAVATSAASPFAVGGSFHQSLAQVVTAGRAGALAAIAAPALCWTDAPLVVEVHGVRPDARGRPVPDGAVRATGTVAAALLPAFADPGAPDFRMLPLSRPLPLAAGERFAFVLSSEGQCALAQAPPGELYPGGDAYFVDDWHRPYFDWVPISMGRLDLPFETWMEPPPLEVAIDVRPGSEENPVNLGARGTIPVAILGSASFDAAAVDLASVTFAGAAPDRGRHGQVRASTEDVNGDGFADVVLHFWIEDLALDAGDGEARLDGSTAGPEGAPFGGSDGIRVVPPRRAP